MKTVLRLVLNYHALNNFLFEPVFENLSSSASDSNTIKEKVIELTCPDNLSGQVLSLMSNVFERSGLESSSLVSNLQITSHFPTTHSINPRFETSS